MKVKTNVSTLLFLIFVSKSLAQEIIPRQSRQGNEITFTCSSETQELITIQVINADGSNPTTPVAVFGTFAMATFTVTPSDEKAAYCEVGDLITERIFFGGECESYKS